MANSKWKDNQVAKTLIERIASLQIHSKNQATIIATFKPYNVSFNAKGFETYKFLLKQEVRFNEEIPAYIQPEILSHAIFKAAENGLINLGYIGNAITKKESEYLQKGLTNYVLITRISLNNVKSNLKVNTPHAKIQIFRHLPLKFKKHHRLEQNIIDYSAINDKVYAWVTILVNTRCIHSAADLALSELNYYLGVMNLFLNGSNSSRTSFKNPEPINKIRKYPYHLLHFEDGSLATSVYWYEPNFSVKGSVQQYDERFKQSSKRYRKFTKDVIRSNRYRFFRNVFNRYSDALESNDMNKSFLNLWSILETLTFTSKDNYDVTIQRTLILFKDRFLFEQELKIIRTKRNMAIHSGEEFEESERLTYMLMNIVNEYIFFMLNVMIKVDRDEEIKAILDLPTNSVKIEKMRNDAKNKIEQLNTLTSLIKIS